MTNVKLRSIITLLEANLDDKLALHNYKMIFVIGCCTLLPLFFIRYIQKPKETTIKDGKSFKNTELVGDKLEVVIKILFSILLLNTLVLLHTLSTVITWSLDNVLPYIFVFQCIICFFYLTVLNNHYTPYFIVFFTLTLHLYFFENTTTTQIILLVAFAIKYIQSKKYPYVHYPKLLVVKWTAALAFFTVLALSFLKITKD